MSDERDRRRRQLRRRCRRARRLTCEAVREMAGAFVLGALDAAEDGGGPRATSPPVPSPIPRSPSSAACCRPSPRAFRWSSRRKG